MSISALALFGSRARGDHEPESDVDLLLVTSEPTHRHVTMGNLSFSIYPFVELMGRAKRGDLFVCHIVNEAKVLYDPGELLKELRSSFHLQKSYNREIGHASDLGWFLVRFGKSLANGSIVTRRIAWCVRTILIARSAERGDPVFSTAKLSAFAELPVAQRLIRQKGQDTLNPVMLDDLRRFLAKCGMADPVPNAASSDVYFSRFEKTANDVACQTLRLAQHESTTNY